MTLTYLNKTEKPYKRKFLKKLKRLTTNIEAKKLPGHGTYTVNGTATSFFPAQNFKSWAVWQNENHSVAAKPQTSQQGATLKSCSNNIKADMAPLL